MTQAALLSLHDLACDYGEQRVVHGLSLDLQAGAIGCLLGPSGCGKTTTLRAIAGFETVSAGRIELAGELLSRPGFSLPTEQRRIGMVFQDYALFPHLSVAQNIAFGIGRHPDQAAIVGQMLELVGLEGLGARHPQDLSGGQQQRVALARALAPEPRLLLLDEPFSNLDTSLRRRLSVEVRDILKQRGTSAILVTHDQEEAFAVSDHVGVFDAGRLQQWATPVELYQHPQTAFVARFIGQGYFIRGRLDDRGRASTELGSLEGVRGDNASGHDVDVLLRPEDIQLAPHSAIKAQILSKTFMGASSLCRLRLPAGTELQAQLPNQPISQVGDEVGIVLRPTPRRWFTARD